MGIRIGFNGSIGNSEKRFFNQSGDTKHLATEKIISIHISVHYLGSFRVDFLSFL